MLAIAVAALMTASVQANESVAGGFEMSGHIVTGMGYQHEGNNALAYAVNNGDYTTYAGPMGRYVGAATTAKNDHMSFFVDEVELDITKSLGENIRLRADLEFGYGTPVNVGLEQAYATANIPVGNGLELLLGRFNTPMGLESVDVSMNDTMSMSVLGAGLRPVSTTGMKLYYAFSDLVDLHFYVVNSLTQDAAARLTDGADIPSMGARLGFNWGEEGMESTIGVSPFFGPETGTSNKHFTFGADVDANVWLTESFALGMEILFRRDNANGGSNSEYLAGLLNMHYVFSDVWDGTLKYAYAKQYDLSSTAISTAVAAAEANTLNMNLTGADGQSVHQLALAGAYSIADGAKFKMEGRFDITKAGTKRYTYGLVAGFVYDF